MSLIKVYKKKDNKYDEQNEIKVYLLVDYLGNIYLKHDETYYIISVDVESGTEINKIYNTAIFRKNLDEYKFLSESVKSGIIKLNSTTLAGKASETLSGMNEEERTEYMEKNDLFYNDSNFDEKKGYWVQYKDKMSDESSDDDIQEESF